MARRKRESRDLVTRNISCFTAADLKENHKGAGVCGKHSTKTPNFLL